VTHPHSLGSASLRVVSVAEKRTAVDETLRAIGVPDPEQDQRESCLLWSSQTVDAKVRRSGVGNWSVTLP